MPAGLFTLALGLRLGFQASVVGMHTAPQDDAAQYDTIAWSLAQGGPYQTSDGYRSSRAPAYPFLLAGLYAVLGHSWMAARIAQAVIDAATCLVIFCLGTRGLGPPIGALAASAYAVFPHAIYWSGFLLTETFAAFLVTAATAALIGAASQKRWTVAWAFLCATASLCRPNLGILFVCGLAWLWAKSPRRLSRCALAIAVFCATLLPWTVRNYMIHHRFVAITTKGGVVLWEGNNPYVESDPASWGRSTSAWYLPQARLVEGLSEAERDAFYFRLALQYMRDNPAELPGLVGRKFVRLWNLFPRLDNRLERSFASMVMVTLVVTFVTGLVFATYRRDHRLLPFLLPALAVTLTALIYWGDARIRAPADPSNVLVAAYGVWGVLQGRVRSQT